jgi:hypothetical protein
MLEYSFEERERYVSYIALINEDPMKELNTLGFLESWNIKYSMSLYDGLTLVDFYDFLSGVVRSGNVAELNRQFLTINPILGEYVVDRDIGKVFVGNLFYNEIVPGTYYEELREYVFTIGGKEFTVIVNLDDDSISYNHSTRDQLPILERRQMTACDNDNYDRRWLRENASRPIIVEENRIFDSVIKKILGTRI